MKASKNGVNVLNVFIIPLNGLVIASVIVAIMLFALPPASSVNKKNSLKYQLILPKTLVSAAKSGRIKSIPLLNESVIKLSGPFNASITR